MHTVAKVEKLQTLNTLQRRWSAHDRERCDARWAMNVGAQQTESIFRTVYRHD
jgi:hypothetical protein